MSNQYLEKGYQSEGCAQVSISDLVSCVLVYQWVYMQQVYQCSDCVYDDCVWSVGVNMCLCTSVCAREKGFQRYMS